MKKGGINIKFSWTELQAMDESQLDRLLYEITKATVVVGTLKLERQELTPLPERVIYLSNMSIGRLFAALSELDKKEGNDAQSTDRPQGQ